MKKYIAFTLVITVTFMLISGFSTEEMGLTVNNGNDEVKKVTGKELFINNCSACHGIDRQGNPPTFPSLVSISDRMGKDQVDGLLKSGRNLMPSFSHLSDAERNAIAGYLFGEKTESEVVTDITPVENGKNLFIANCSRCHRLTSGDPQPPDQRDYGMTPAILGGISKKHDPETFKNILNAGPCYMPSFVSLSEDDKEDIYSFLKTLENEYADEKSMTGRGCRMRCGR